MNLTPNDRFYIYRRCKISLPTKMIREHFSITDLKKQNLKFFEYIHHISSPNKNELVDCILLLAHPVIRETENEEIKIDTSKRIAIVCIGVEYTVYKRVNDASDKATDLARMQIARKDEFNVKNGRFNEYSFKDLVFYSEKSANQVINANDAKDYFNNRHDILFEFNYKCNAIFHCFKCERFVDEYCSECDFQYVCPDCHPHHSQTKRVKSVYLQNRIPSIKLNSWCKDQQFAICKDFQVNAEIITAVPPEYLPWDKPVLDEIMCTAELNGFSIKVY